MFYLIMKKLFASGLLALAALGGFTASAQNYPNFYLRGSFCGWSCQSEYQFSRNENTYSLTVANLDGQFKVGDDTENWTYNFGSDTGNVEVISGTQTVTGRKNGQNFSASNLHDVTISFDYVEGSETTMIKFAVNGGGGGGGEQEENYPVLYLRGAFSNDNWAVHDEYKFSRTGNVYKLTVPSLSGEFKISDSSWTHDFGAAEVNEITGSCRVQGRSGGGNFQSPALNNVEISFPYNLSNPSSTTITFIVDGQGIDDNVRGLSGTLPVLYINVKNEDGSYNNEIIDKNLAHKNYFKGEYWLDLNGCSWMEAQGAASIGSKEEPLPLEIKARGNYTRKAYAKKPFKLKLGAKQKMLGLTKSKHFAILAHADDNKGYLRNFVGFNLGKRMELPWAPGMQPVEVVMNGDYRGLYFLTESIRVESDRVNIEELADNETDPALVSGGYLIELDNYDEENQIRMEEKGQFWGPKDVLRITFDTPEEYSNIQYQFVNEQFSTMNDLIGQNSDNLWKYMDLDDAARYYLVEEIISHTEAYHGSTYMFRDRGAGKKWHFSPLWDCGNAFNGPTNNYFYNETLFGNTWVGSLRMNSKFNDKVRATWLWFMSNKYTGIEEDINTFVDHIRQAAIADRARWKDAPKPTNESSVQDVVDNTNMTERAEEVKSHLRSKINWLKDQFGNYLNMTMPEPERDTTPAADLPVYIQTAIGEISADIPSDITEIYDIRGFRVSAMNPGEVYIVRSSNGDYTKVMGK